MASSSVVSARLAKRLETVQQQLQDAQQQHCTQLQDAQQQLRATHAAQKQLQDAQQQHLRATHAAQKQLQALEAQTDNLCTVYERFRETLEAALKANPHPAVQAAFAAMTRNWRQALTLVDGSASAVESGSDEEEGSSESANSPEFPAALAEDVREEKPTGRPPQESKDKQGDRSTSSDKVDSEGDIAMHIARS